MANDSRDIDGGRLIFRVLHSLNTRYGRSFSKADLHRIVKPILTSVGRPDMNYGSWTACDCSRPFRLVRDDSDRSKAIIEITNSWLVRIGGEAEFDQEQEHEEWNRLIQLDNGESYDDYMARKMADPKQ